MKTIEDDNYPFEWRFKTEEIQVLRKLIEHQVPFFIDGGVACCFHGARKVWECTNDIDIVLSPDAESAQFLTNALSEIGPIYNFHSNLYADFIALPRKQWKFPDGTFDFRTIDSREEFLRHFGYAVGFSLDGLELKIASPVTVQELKQVAIAANQNAEKHQADIDKLNALQLSSGSKGDASLYDNRNSSQ